MLKRIAMAVAALVVLAGVGVGIAGATSATSSTNTPPAARVLRLVGTQAWKLDIPVSGQPQQNRRPGDERLMVQDVTKRATGRLVARSLIDCTMFRKDALCSITFVFQTGQITLSGKIPADTNSKPFIVPVTGGSGRYQGARGQLVAMNPRTINATYETIYLLP
jgi:hypothetical protein